MLKKLFTSAPLESIILDDIKFSIKHTLRKNMKRIILRVSKKGEIQLSSSKLSKQRLLEFIKSQKEWILQQNMALKEPFSEGSSFYYLSCAYLIRHHTRPLQLAGSHVYLNPLNAKTQSDNFYKRVAQEQLPLRVEFWRIKMGLDFHALRFHCARRRWGSCSSKGIITLNPYMMKLEPGMIDYIIVHELAHLEHMNHSKAFYDLVKIYIPDYISIQKQINALSLKMLRE